MQSSKQQSSNNSSSLNITNDSNSTNTTTTNTSSNLMINNNKNYTNNNSNSNTSSTSSITPKTTKWIKQFCSTEKNQFLCKVDLDFISDVFNLIGLEEEILHYRKALKIILDKECYYDSSSTDDTSSDDCREIEILSSAETLYGLIHARFIMTDAGLQRMLYKYQKRRFGTCIRYYCEKCPMLPIGLSDKPGIDSVRLYCPKCKDIYIPHFSSKCVSLDGAYFGTSFPHMFFMVYPSYRPKSPTESYVPKLYGFKIHEKAYEYQGKEVIEKENSVKKLLLSKSPNLAIINSSSSSQQQQQQFTITPTITTTAAAANGLIPTTTITTAAIIDIDTKNVKDKI